MASSSTSQLQLLSGDDLCKATLRPYLKDPTFVEYFNAFLLLPAFSNRLFYNGETGFFEQVHGEAWTAEEDKITPSSSLATLYLTDEVVGPSVDKQQSWEWVTQHRLPLFLRSDLFSEYKLCKLLTTPDHGSGTGSLSDNIGNASETLKAQNKLTIYTRLPVSSNTDTTPHSHSSSNSAVCLPSLSGRQNEDAPSGDSSPSMMAAHSRVALSKSDVELGSGGDSASRGTSSPKQAHHPKLQKQVSMSANVPCIVLDDGLLGQQDRTSGRSTVKGSIRMTAGDFAFMGTKSGMNAFWKFLKGTMGERNWLFWLDAEHVKYYTKPIDQRRFLREVREKYLHSGSPLELPAETRNRLRVNKASRLTLAQLKELQSFMVQGLREYWCPRFILHSRSEEEILSLRPHHPSLPASPTAALQHHGAPGNGSASSLTPNYPRGTTPFTPSRTPTFRRLSSSRHRSKTSPHYTKSGPYSNHSSPSAKDTNLKILQVAAGMTDEAGGAQHHENVRPRTVAGVVSGGAGSRLPASPLTTNTASGSRRAQSRRVWDYKHSAAVESTTSAGGSPKDRSAPRKTSLARSNQAKYTLQHLVDPNSRCASGMDCPDSRGMCESRCQIVSVSGTPLHSVTSSPQHYIAYGSSEAYSSLLHCLNTEQRKAGGYLQNHLETLENKIFLNCLLFWFEVQKYKALFVGSSFSPCTVEMKAKALYSSYISDGCDKYIDCPVQLCGIISSNLWPAYEDLFDAVEEHALALLLIPWLELCSSEDRTFQELEVLSRPVSYTCLIPLEDLDGEGICDGDDTPPKFSSHSHPAKKMSMHRLHIDSSTSSLQGSSSRLGGLSQATSLNDIMKNRAEFEHFKIFLNEHLAAQDLMCWMEIEAFRGIPVCDKAIRDIKAKQLRTNYFNKKYFFGPNSPATKEQQRQTVQAGGGGYGCRLPARPRTPVFREAQKHVRRRLEKKWLAEFITTPDFISRNGGSLFKDGLKIKRTSTHSQSQLFCFERTFANSHEAILFRKVLQDKVQRHLLQRYLSIKQIPYSSTMMSFAKQNIEFWLEVQRYKEMCHVHTTDTMIQNKVNAIIDNYFQSSTPPKLQLNVPMNVAEEVTLKPHGPYVFRVAQAAVFKHLFSHWEEYQNFTSGYYASEDVVHALDKLEHQLTTSITAEKEQESRVRREQEQLRMAIPRFETEAEKQERLKMEQELAEFGRVSEAFRLSNPNPRYTYYTDLPESFYTEEMRMLRQKATDGICPVEPDGRRHSTCDKDIAATVPATKESPGRKTKINHSSQVQQPIARHPKLLPRENNNNNSESPVITMKLERGYRPATKDSKTEETMHISFEEEVKSKMPLKPESSHQQLLLQRQVSRSLFHLKRANSRLMRRPTMAKKLHDMRYTPHSTINMRFSDGPQTFELYGGGLPPEQSSHLTILNVTTNS